MGNRRYDEWERDSEVYTPAQVEAIASFCGLGDYESETYTHFLYFCPFHPNSDTPAFALDKTRGLWTCFNPACNNAGNLEQLLARLKGQNPFEAARTVLKYQSATSQSVSQRLEALKEGPKFVEFPGNPVERMQRELWEPVGREALDYLRDERKFDNDTLQYFGIGYSTKKDMVIIPMHDPVGMLVGFIGRSVKDKEFKNTKNLPKSLTTWNYHRAKRHGEAVIVVEASFDAMRVHQAGYPNVVALLGGHLSPHHVDQLNKTFSEIIIMTDFDKRENAKPNCRQCLDRPMVQGVRCIGHRPGRELGHSIERALPNKRIKWAAYDDTCVYPHGAKDAGDMTDDEIRRCLKNAVGKFTYATWGIEDADLTIAS